MKPTVIILLVYLITVFDSSNSLLCYECNHRINKDPKCEIIAEYATDHLFECEKYSRCLQITIYPTTGGNLMMRKCANEPTADWCETLNSTRAVCELCDTDGCNNSPLVLRQ